MENREDKLMTDLFGKNKVEIEDNGFSRRVMNRLPEKKKNTNWIVPLFTIIGIVISMLVIDIREIINQIFNRIIEIPIYYLLGGIMIFPLIVLFVYLYWEKNQLSSFKF